MLVLLYSFCYANTQRHGFFHFQAVLQSIVAVYDMSPMHCNVKQIERHCDDVMKRGMGKQKRQQVNKGKIKIKGFAY